MEDRHHDALAEIVFPGDADPSGIDRGLARIAANSVYSMNGHERNLLFLREERGFTHLGAVSGADAVTDGRSFVALDADDDGDLDLVVKNFQKRTLHYLRNDVATTHHRVAFRLQGTRSHRDAIGARLVLIAGDRRQTREVRSAAGFLAQSPREVFFGLGGATTVNRLEIRWPSGRVQVVEDLASDRRYRIVEGRAPEVLHRFPAANHLGLAADAYPATHDRPLALATVRRALPLPARSLNGVTHPGGRGFSRPTLVAFVTPWCRSCQSDLAVLQELASRPRRPFDVAAVLVRIPGARDAELAAFARYSFPVLDGDPDLLLRYRQSPSLIVPATFWVGADGMIRRSHVGRLDGTALLRELTTLARGR